MCKRIKKTLLLNIFSFIVKLERRRILLCRQQQKDNKIILIRKNRDEFCSIQQTKKKSMLPILFP